MRPGPHHVPGSYRSEASPALNSNCGTEGSSANEKPSGLKQSLVGVHLPKTATRALSDFQEHHPSTKEALSAQPEYVAPSLTHKTSHSTLQSNNTIRGGYNPLLHSGADLFGLSKPAEPVITPNLEHRYSYNEDQLVAQAMPPKKNMVDVEKIGHKVLTTYGIHHHDQGHQRRERISAPSDEQVSKLLARHPPFSDDVIKRLSLEQTVYPSDFATPNESYKARKQLTIDLQS